MNILLVPVRLSAVGSVVLRVSFHDFNSHSLAGNPTAQDLASQLPLTLTIRDFNDVEKIAALPRPLTTDGVPASDDPDINEIG